MAGCRTSLATAVLLLLAFHAHSSAAVVITNGKKEIAIQNSMVRIQETLDVKNDGKSELKEVSICNSSPLASHLAFSEVVQGSGEDFFEAKTAPIEVPGAPTNITCRSVTLNPTLKAGATTTIRSFSVYTHTLVPFPAKITQKDQQLVVFEDYVHIVSPYAVASAETQVRLPSSTIPSHSIVDPTSKSKDKITYGPYAKVAPFTLTPLRLHFEHAQPFATVTELVREIEVSHWGNVYVEEHYTVVHTGAQLTGPWSRLDYQMNPGVYARNSIQALHLELPGPARWMYYRDEIGNISTSKVRSTKTKTDVVLEPRYPLFGGWKAKFIYGYSLPLGFVVSKARGGSLQLTAPVGCNIRDATVDNLTIKVVLPEGATRIRTTLPFADMHESRSTKYTYLDVGGRPVVVLSMSNLVAEHLVPFVVSYRFSFLAMLREPVLLIAALLILFALAVGLSRLDLAISRDAKYMARLEHEKLVDIAQRLDATLTQRRSVLRDLDVAAATKPVAECAEARTAAEASFKASDAQVRALLEELKGLGGSREADRFVKVVEEERALVQSSLALFVKKVDLVKQGAKAAEIEKKLGSQEKAVVDAAKAVKAACDTLFESF